MLLNALRQIYPGISIGEAGASECSLSFDGLEYKIETWDRQDARPNEADVMAMYDDLAYKRSLIKPVTRRQFKLGLLAIGLLDDVEAAIAASNDRSLQINYAEALDFDRNNPFVLQMSAALGKTDPEIDVLFQLAASL